MSSKRYLDDEMVEGMLCRLSCCVPVASPGRMMKTPA
jgi:hypothetical protein